MKGLNLKEEAFCQNYVRLGEERKGAEAARQAKYSPKSAKAIASQLLKRPEIQQRIEEVRKELSKKISMTAEQAIQNIQNMANREGKFDDTKPKEALAANITICKIKGVKGLADKVVIEEKIPFDGLGLEELRAIKKYLEEKNRFPKGASPPDIRTVAGYLSERLPKESGTGDN